MRARVNTNSKGETVRTEPYRITFVDGKWVLYKRELCASGMWNPLYENEYFTMVEVYLRP